MKKVKGICLVLDGPDHGGKTSLANHLIEKYRFNYYHCGVVDNILQYHNNVMFDISKDISNYMNNWIIDRFHFSEEVFSNIFRNGPQYNFLKYDKILQNNIEISGGIFKTVFCLPPKKISVDGHKQRLLDGNEMFASVDTVYDSYNLIFKKYKQELNIDIYDFTIDSDYAIIDKNIENMYDKKMCSM